MFQETGGKLNEQLKSGSQIAPSFLSPEDFAARGRKTMGPP